MTESSLKNKESLIYTAATRGMIRALCKLTTNPSELVTILNDLIVNDPLRHNFSLSYVTIDPKIDTLQYIACGEGQLCYFNGKLQDLKKIDNQNPFLGLGSLTEFKGINHPFEVGDSLFLISISGALLKTHRNNDFFEKELIKYIVENAHLPAEQQTRNILKRLKIVFSKSIYDSLISIISIKHI